MHKWVLWGWREWAAGAAHSRGARKACDLCKRAIMGNGRVEVYPPWNTTFPKVRLLCTDCWKRMTTMLDEAEYELDNYDLGIDWIAQGNRKGQHNAEMEQAATRRVVRTTGQG